MLVFPTVLSNTAFLNVATDESNHRRDTVDRLKREGWKPGIAESYSIFKYRAEGDTLLLWAMSEDAKKQAIRSGKIKGDAADERKNRAEPLHRHDGERRPLRRRRRRQPL